MTTTPAHDTIDADTSGAGTRQRLAFFVGFGAAAAISAGIIWAALPHEHTIKALWVFLVKLIPFIFAAEAIAWLDPRWIRNPLLKMLIVMAPFAVFFVYFVPELFIYSGDPNGFDTFYYYILTLTPLIILALTLAFRLGGGNPGQSRRMAYAMLLLMLSGAEDLAYQLLSHTPIASVWDWAYHMEVFIGHFPTRTEAYVFIGVHLLLAALVLTVPTRWFRRDPGPVTATAESTGSDSVGPDSTGSGFTGSDATGSDSTESAGTVATDEPTGDSVTAGARDAG